MEDCRETPPSASTSSDLHYIDKENQVRGEENQASDKENQQGKKASLRNRRFQTGFTLSLDLRSIYSEENRNHSPGDADRPRSSKSETAYTKASNAVSEHRLFGFLRKGHNMRSQDKHTPKLTRRENKIIRTEPIKEDHPVPQLTSPVKNPSLDPGFCCFKSSWRNFTLSELEAATNNFGQEYLIGEGGYAQVFKGQLEDGQHVAIKRLAGGSQEEMTGDFLSELGIMVHVDHINVAKVIGYGVEGGMHLVLHLSPHGSLSSILYGSRERLDWGIRYKVALGTAEGLLYLHEGCQRRIIHRDIKASNILLSEDFDPQISDFGLAKWLPDQWTHHVVSSIEGTFGYLPPEFFMHGIVDEKTDVYAYGVLLLELITGRQALDSSQKSLVMWAKPLLSKECIIELVDPYLFDAYDVGQMELMLSTASICVHQYSNDRPTMSQAVQILKGDENLLESLKGNGERLELVEQQELLSIDLIEQEQEDDPPLSLELIDQQEEEPLSSDLLEQQQQEPLNLDPKENQEQGQQHDEEPLSLEFVEHQQELQIPSTEKVDFLYTQVYNLTKLLDDVD